MALSHGEFSRMVAEYGPAMYRMAYRMLGDSHEAEDLVQETFRSAWTSRDRYEPSRGTRAWLAVILRRRSADRWRRRGWPVVSSNGDISEVGVPAVDPVQAQYTDEMQEALNGLSPDLREALLLVVVGELTHQEAAEVLGVPLGTVLSRVSRARQRLRSRLVAAQKRA